METGHGGGSHKYHGHGPLIYDVYLEVNSLPLHAPFDKDEKERLQTMSKGSNRRAKHIRQSINALVGIAVGVCCFLVDIGSEEISEFRLKLFREQLRLMGTTTKGSSEFIGHAIWASVLAIAAYVVFSLAAALIVVFEPRSSSSGVPQVIAFLNGVNQKGVLCAKVFCCKICGTIISVGSGLCLGPEGPLIHMGAMLGLLVVRRVLRPALKYVCGPSARRMEEELSRTPLRYDIQAAAMGAGAGVAAAFQAPLAGTMFVVEEASSFFSVKLFFHTFVTCACAVFTSMALKAASRKELYNYYSRNTSCFGTYLGPGMILQVSVVAIICTVLAILFNNLIICCNTHRTLQNRRFKLFKRRCVRVGEVLALAVVTSMFAVWLPVFTTCQDASMQNLLKNSGGCVNDAWMFQIMRGSASRAVVRADTWWDRMRDISDVDRDVGYYPTSSLFGATFDPVHCPKAIQDNPQCAIENIIIPEDKQGLWQTNYYCCGYTSSGNIMNTTQPIANLSIGPTAFVAGACPETRLVNQVPIQQYSAGSSLWLVPPQTVAKTLWTRGSPGLLPISDLAMYLVGYGTLTALTSGSWVPGGVLVPQLVIGGSAGRLIGEIWLLAYNNNMPRFPWAPEMKPLLDRLNIPYDSSEFNSVLSIPDPGVLALAGSAAFLSASGSLALFAVVLLLEITFDWLMMPVIVLAVLVARTLTTVLGSHGLYHRLIDVASLPFLDEHTHWRLSRWTAKDILNEDLRHARASATAAGDIAPETIEDILLSVRKHASSSEVRAVLLREIPGNAKAIAHAFPVVGPDGQLGGLVTREALMGLLARGDGDENIAEENVRHIFSTAISALVSRRTSETGQSQGTADPSIGVDEVADTAPWVVQASTPAHQIHAMFRQLGLRHVVVVDERHQPVGMLTRKSLMPWRCPMEAGAHDSFAAIRHAREPLMPPDLEH